MTFAEKLREARKEAGLTQKELAQKCHIGLRSITNYENGTHLPQKEEIYTTLAHALDVTPESLKDENSDFIIKARQQYGGRGSKQAEEIIRSFRVAAAGGELDDNDLDYIKEAMMQTYWDAKKYNQRFVNKRYLKGNDADGKEG